MLNDYTFIPEEWVRKKEKRRRGKKKTKTKKICPEVKILALSSFMQNNQNILTGLIIRSTKRATEWQQPVNHAEFFINSSLAVYLLERVKIYE